MIHTGDCIEVMAKLDADSVDAVVTDPPYGLEFMGKGWDKFGGTVEAASDSPGWRAGHGGLGVASKNNGVPFGGGGQRIRYSNAGPAFQAWCTEWGREALRVTKPGGYLLAFGGTRTHHRLVCGLEDAGWIIRDELTWVYASGFPKGKANLKPAHEPIVLARKPGPLRHLNIEENRIGTNGERIVRDFDRQKPSPWEQLGDFPNRQSGVWENTSGRWPSNLLLSDPALFDEPNPGIIGSGSTDEGAGYSRFFTIPQNTPLPRFWEKAEKSGGCWVWKAYKDIQGYGRFALNSKRRNVHAHRLAWELTYGPIPDGMHVLHHCDNPPCVRPAHLFIGSHADNMADMAAKGRGSSNGQVGEDRYNAKLTDEMVIEARQLREGGATFTELAARYGVSHTTISEAVRGVNWSHVPTALIIPKAARADREPVLKGGDAVAGARLNAHPT